MNYMVVFYNTISNQVDSFVGLIGRRLIQCVYQSGL